MYTPPTYACIHIRTCTRHEITLTKDAAEPTHFELFAMLLAAIDLAGIVLSIVAYSADSRYLQR